MKAVVAAFNQEKALVGALSVITNLRMDLFEALAVYHVISNLELEGMWWRWQCCGAEKLRFLINIPLLSPQQL